MSETWQNTYSGFDRAACRDWSGSIACYMRKVLPPPMISPTCAKKGHDWSEPIVWFPGAPVYGCKRCAKRGLLVLETRAA